MKHAKSAGESVMELQELLDGQALTSEQIAQKIGRGLIATRSAICVLVKKGELIKDQSGGYTGLYSLPQPGTTITPRDLLTWYWKPTKQMSGDRI